MCRVGWPQRGAKVLIEVWRMDERVVPGVKKIGER